MPNYQCNTQNAMCRGNFRMPPPNSCGPAVSQRNAASVACCPARSDYDELDGMPIAMAYVPWQAWRNLYEVEKGFSRGTIFEELDKPFRGTGGRAR